MFKNKNPYLKIRIFFYFKYINIMHDRDLVWIKANGEHIKIRNMTSSHLINILNLLERDFTKFVSIYGKNKMLKAKKNIKQEIRYRKINRINMENNNELF